MYNIQNNHIKLRIIIFCFLTLISFPIRAELFEKYPGESFILPIPKCPVQNGYVNSWSYSCSSSTISIETDKSGIGTAMLRSYSSQSFTIECFFSYSFQINGKLNFGTSTEYHRVKSKSNNITISAGTSKVAVGDKISLNYSFSHSTFDGYPVISWSSSSTCASVDASGNVTGMYPGKATISAYSNFGDNVSKFDIEVVKIDPTNVSLIPSVDLIRGNTIQLNPSIVPTNASTTYAWRSDNSNIATVSAGGVVSGIKQGSTTIHVKTSNGLNASCKVKVTNPKLTLTSSLESGLYSKGVKLELKSNCSDATIYYSDDGTTPTPKSKKYDSPIELTQDMEFRAIAFHEDYLDSEILILHLRITDLMVTAVASNSIKSMSTINFPFIEFNQNILPEFVSEKIAFKSNGENIEYEIHIFENTVIFEPSIDLIDQGRHYSIEVEEGCFKSENGCINKPISFEVKTFPFNNEYSDYPLKVYAGWPTSAYLTNSGRLIPFGGWVIESSGAWSYPLQYLEYFQDKAFFENVAFSCKSEEMFPYIDKNNNLFVSGPLPNSTFYDSPVIFREEVIEVALGHEGNLFFITAKGELYGLGSDRLGQLLGKGNITISDATGTFGYSNIPVLLMDNVKHVYSGDRNCAVILNDGTLLFWGLYDGHNYTPKTLRSAYMVAENVVQASVGNQEPVLYITDNNVAWYLDYNLKSHKIADNVKYVEGSYKRGYYITMDNKLYGWGRNDKGQLGDGTITTDYKYLLPENAKLIMENIIDVSCGWNYTLAISSDNCIYGWGVNDCYRLLPDKEKDYMQTTPIKIVAPQKNPVIEDIILPARIKGHIGSRIVIPRKTVPLNGSCFKIEWESSNSSILTIDENGIITPVSEGECDVIVKAICNDGSTIEKTIKVTISTEISSDIEKLWQDTDEIVDVYNSQGMFIFHGSTANMPSLTKGIYIIKSKNKTSKIII